jgi:hypothetical protein
LFSFAPADLPKHKFGLANPRNFHEVNVQKSGGFANIGGSLADMPQQITRA